MDSNCKLYSAFGKSLRNCKRCWKWRPRASIQAWNRLNLFADTFCRSAFEKSLCTYKRCWKWRPRASIQAWTRLILFANTFCRSAFVKSLCTYKSCWKWCPRASIQAWTRFNLFANTFCRSAFGKSLCTYKRCWKWCPRTSIQTTKSTYRSLSAQLLSERTVDARFPTAAIQASRCSSLCISSPDTLACSPPSTRLLVVTR
jgi:Pyruvate/2-oxoacid:ferredoxin oxidoreductase delta subunit